MTKNIKDILKEVDKDSIMDKEDIGTLIRHWRKAKGIKLADLSYRIGVSGPYLSRCEMGNIYPSLLTLLKIAKVLDVDVIQLIPHSKAPQCSLCSVLSDKEKELLFRFIYFLLWYRLRPS